jgi:DivIVA domain-containing protein
MEWFLAVVAVAVIAFAAVAASGRFGQFGPAPTDLPEPVWPVGRPLTSSDIDRLGFAVVPRGYSMAQVDEFCDLVKARLAELEGASSLGAEG